MTSGRLLGHPGQIFAPVHQGQVFLTFGSSFPIGTFCFVGWIHFNSLSHCPSACGSAALVSRFLVFIGFAMRPTGIYLVPAVYQAVHLLQGCSRVESACVLSLAAPCIAGETYGKQVIGTQCARVKDELSAVGGCQLLLASTCFSPFFCIQFPFLFEKG